ncbi:MAG: histidine phosphatase family protein [Candidatus Solibacter usitatus]|nr:histidine phosphatase family protein [Candidatus Solibacter usitatus]
MSAELWLIRHGETEWSRSGAHTGRTDVPLTPEGEEHARVLGSRLSGRRFALVLSSPLRRALDTSRLAGFGDAVRIAGELREWDYGEYEGRTTADIRKETPGWSIWTGGAPGGETVEQVAGRARRVIEQAAGAGGDVALFGHGHLLRVLAACWMGLEPAAGRLLALGTGSISVLGYERETRVIVRWNQ